MSGNNGNSTCDLCGTERETKEFQGDCYILSVCSDCIGNGIHQRKKEPLTQPITSNPTSKLIKLPPESSEGLRKLGNDIRTLIKRKPKQTKLDTGTTSRFGFIDVIKVSVGFVVAVVTIKAVLWIWSF